jgi:hypothetical protein
LRSVLAGNITELAVSGSYSRRYSRRRAYVTITRLGECI